jgi:cytosine/adenosine deaminase-related metal-dependent hydrolase
MAGKVTFLTRRADGVGTSLRVEGSTISSMGTPPAPDDVVVDLRGDRLLPGLINAHDHLQLNSLPPLQSTEPWRHAREWVTEINLRRRTDPVFESHLKLPVNERLLIGGVKNLLSGVTTVAHHDRLYAFLQEQRFPVDVIRDFGMSHSLYIDGDDALRQAYRNTPADWPWIIHLAEGVDAEAAGEFERLESLGCLGANTVIVHGIALDQTDASRLLIAGGGLIWCPSSNLRLFGKTAAVADLVSQHRVALGTDSRFSGCRDLLTELQVARGICELDADVLESLVTSDAADLLRLKGRGRLEPGARADLMVLPEGMALCEASRADVRLVMLGGRPMYADPDYARLLAPASHWAEVLVDGRRKMLEAGLTDALSSASIGEPGLEITRQRWAAA